MVQGRNRALLGRRDSLEHGPGGRGGGLCSSAWSGQRSLNPNPRLQVRAGGVPGGASFGRPSSGERGTTGYEHFDRRGPTWRWRDSAWSGRQGRRDSPRLWSSGETTGCEPREEGTTRETTGYEPFDRRGPLPGGRGCTLHPSPWSAWRRRRDDAWSGRWGGGGSLRLCSSAVFRCGRRRDEERDPGGAAVLVERRGQDSWRSAEVGTERNLPPPCE